MKKKGFTLVELLAVIAILAILVIVAMPNVLGMFNQAKVSSFVTEVQKIMDTATTTFTRDALVNSGKAVYYSSEGNATLGTKELDMSGNKKNYFIEMDRNGEFKRVVVFDDNYCYDVYSNYGSISIGDLSSSTSLRFNKKIDKSDVIVEDIFESGNDSVDISTTSSTYKVLGCESHKTIDGKNIGSFYIDRDGFGYYSFEIGMTFEEWFASKYNVDGLIRFMEFDDIPRDTLHWPWYMILKEYNDLCPTYDETIIVDNGKYYYTLGATTCEDW